MDVENRPNGSTSWVDLLSSALSAAVGVQRVAQLATTRGPASGSLAGKPACRCVNIRSFENGKLYFATDIRSGKVDDAAHSSYVELCWYSSRQSLQFRILGQHRILKSCEKSNAVWQTLSEHEKTWWAWPYPGEKWSGDDAFKVSPSPTPPQNFCLFEIIPSHVQILDLSVVPFHREDHSLVKEDGREEYRWNVQRVNP